MNENYVFLGALAVFFLLYPAWLFTLETRLRSLSREATRRLTLAEQNARDALANASKAPSGPDPELALIRERQLRDARMQMLSEDDTTSRAARSKVRKIEDLIQRDVSAGRYKRTPGMVEMIIDGIDDW